MQPRTGGQILADQLARLGTEFVFTVPGESFLGLLDGLYPHRDHIKVVPCRHESGAANMAEAVGKLTGRPGVAAVTRGPGATHAASGIHTAFQDSTPMILLLGQVARSMRDREAFQEVDFRAMFTPLAKWTAEIDDPARIPEYLSRAWVVAQEGRPGPVVLSLPEDMLTETATAPDLVPPVLAQPAPSTDCMEALATAIAGASRPLLVLGGPSWHQETSALATVAAEHHGLAVATTFRRQDLFDNTHELFVGTLGIAPGPKLWTAVRDEVDLLIVVGARLGEMTTGGYTLLASPEPRPKLVHVHPAPDEIGRVYRADIPVAATSRAFLRALASLPAKGAADTNWRKALRDAYLDHLKPIAGTTALQLGDVVACLSSRLPADTIVTNGAGNYAGWLHRHYQHRQFPTQLAPTSGSMGYGVPAAIAAKLVHPRRRVVSVAGDGCFMMSSQELATARHHNLPIIWIVVNNGMYGTIRMHQEREYPARIIGTDLTNPDFVAYAASFGIPGQYVEKTSDFEVALKDALASPEGYLIELKTDPDILSPTQTVTGLRS